MKKPTALQYAIVDIETTGGRPDRDKITEIGIVLHNGTSIVDSWSSLVNPGVTIPPFISRMTGITQEMVEDAPYFHEIAKEVILRLEKAVFVAHNARFDYHFIRESFRDLGFTFSRPFLCTVKLSRQAFPGLPSYSLGNLITHFQLSAEKRHRALEDALATAQLLERILATQAPPLSAVSSHREISQLKRHPVHLPVDVLDKVPDECGIYYFRNKTGKIIYVGKSIHIRKRLDEHLQSITRKADRLDREIADIDWVVTGSELYACLLESYEIKRHQPELNRAQRNARYDYGIQCFPSEEGYLRFQIVKITEPATVIQQYANKRAAQHALQKALEHFQLCRHYVHQYLPSHPCFEHQTGTCSGACCGKEEVQAYNERVLLATAQLSQDLEGSFFLLDRGPEARTQSVFYVENGRYVGMGVCSTEEGHDVSCLEAAIRSYPDSPEVRRIIRQFMAKHPLQRVIRQ